MTIALSGKAGHIEIGTCTLQGFTNGTLTYGSDPVEYFAQSGNGAAQTHEGADSGSGTIEVVVLDEPVLTSATLKPGLLATLVFSHDGTTEATGQARLGKFTWTLNKDGQTQKATIPFTTHGAWTLPGVS